MCLIYGSKFQSLFFYVSVFELTVGVAFLYSACYTKALPFHGNFFTLSLSLETKSDVELPKLDIMINQFNFFIYFESYLNLFRTLQKSTIKFYAPSY